MATPRAAVPEHEHDHASGGCRVGEVFELLSKAHMLDILHVLTHGDRGPQRFNELQDALGISPNTLTDRLKALVAAELVTRTAYKEIPPRVEYEATAKALDLRPIFEAISAWAQRHSL